MMCYNSSYYIDVILRWLAASCAPLFQLMSFRPDPEVESDDPDVALVQSIPGLMEQHCVIPTVATNSVERLRGSWMTHFFVVNQYPSPDKFQEFGELGMII